MTYYGIITDDENKPMQLSCGLTQTGDAYQEHGEDIFFIGPESDWEFLREYMKSPPQKLYRSSGDDYIRQLCHEAGVPTQTRRLYLISETQFDEIHLQIISHNGIAGKLQLEKKSF